MRPVGERTIRVILTDEALDALGVAADLTGDTRTDVVSRALIMYAMVVDLHVRGGGPVAFDHGDGSTVRVEVDRRRWFG